MSTVPTDKKLNVTPGKVRVEHGCIYFLNNGTPPQNRAYIRCTQGRNDNGDWISMDECNANLALYADAHNAYKNTFLLPSELAEQLEEATEIIRSFSQPSMHSSNPGKGESMMGWQEGEGDVWSRLDKARAFLSRTSPTDPTPPEK